MFWVLGVETFPHFRDLFLLLAFTAREYKFVYTISTHMAKLILILNPIIILWNVKLFNIIKSFPFYLQTNFFTPLTAVASQWHQSSY